MQIIWLWLYSIHANGKDYLVGVFICLNYTWVCSKCSFLCVKKQSTKLSLCLEMSHSMKYQFTYIYNNTLGLAGTQNPRRRVWRAGTSQRIWAGHWVSVACCIPNAWSPWLCHHMCCSHRSSPCRGHSARSSPRALSPHSVGSRRPSSHLCRHRCGSLHGETCRIERGENKLLNVTSTIILKAYRNALWLLLSK